MNENLKMLKVDFTHQDEESLIEGLEMFFAIYANKENWRTADGRPPHYLREGMLLNFHPSNIVHGYCFAQEALEKIKKFRQRKEKPLSWLQKLFLFWRGGE